MLAATESPRPQQQQCSQQTVTPSQQSVSQPVQPDSVASTHNTSVIRSGLELSAAIAAERNAMVAERFPPGWSAAARRPVVSPAPETDVREVTLEDIREAEEDARRADEEAEADAAARAAVADVSPLSLSLFDCADYCVCVQLPEEQRLCPRCKNPPGTLPDEPDRCHGANHWFAKVTLSEPSPKRDECEDTNELERRRKSKRWAAYRDVAREFG